MSKNNRRQQDRVPARGVATHYKAGSQMGLAMQVENISSGGLFVKSDELLPIGTPISLELLDGAPAAPLKVTGRVVGHVTRWQAQTHGRTPGMGIQFDPLTGEAQKRVDKLLKNLRSQTTTGPAVVDDDMASTRSQAFDFGFSTLEDLSSEDSADHGRPPAQPKQEPKVVEAPADQMLVPQDARLMVQVRGLMMELGDNNSRIARLERENEALKAENKRLKDELARYRRPL